MPPGRVGAELGPGVIFGLHLPEVAVRVEADPMAAAPEGSPDPRVPAVLQDAIGEQGFLGEHDENGHIA